VLTVLKRRGSKRRKRRTRKKIKEPQAILDFHQSKSSGDQLAIAIKVL